MKTYCRSSLIFVALTLGACASPPVPTQQLAQSEANAKAADELGAKRHPRAAYYLQLASENIDRANKLIAAGENEQAHFSLMRADADAELSLAMAKEAQARSEADEAQAKLQAIRSQKGTQP